MKVLLVRGLVFLCGAGLIDRAELTDQHGRRLVAWAVVEVPAQYYLPIISTAKP